MAAKKEKKVRRVKPEPAQKYVPLKETCPAKKNGQKEMVALAIEMFQDNYSHSEVKRVIRERKTGVVNEVYLTNILSLASSHLKGEYSIEQNNVRTLHAKRYNDEIKRLLATKMLDQEGIGEQYTYEAWEKSRQKMNNAYLLALDTIGQKEDVLKVIKAYVMLEVNNNLIEQEIIVKPKWNVSKLSFEEQVELLQLLKESRKDAFEIPAITNPDEATQTTIDISHEVVKEEPANIEQIKHEEIPVKPDKRKLTSIDPTLKLRELMKKKAEEILSQNAGAGTKVWDAFNRPVEEE